VYNAQDTILNGERHMGPNIRQVLVYPDEDGYWVAEVPSLPGCNTQGDTREEALVNIKDAIEGYIEVLRAAGRPIPDETREVVGVSV